MTKTPTPEPAKPYNAEIHLEIHWIKIRIFSTNVPSLPLHGLEYRRTSVATERKLEVFQTKCLQRILKIYWPNVISNELRVAQKNRDLYNIENQKKKNADAGLVMCSLCPTPHSLPRVGLCGTPQGKRNRGRPKETWTRTVLKGLINETIYRQYIE